MKKLIPSLFIISTVGVIVASLAVSNNHVEFVVTIATVFTIAATTISELPKYEQVKEVIHYTKTEDGVGERIIQLPNDHILYDTSVDEKMLVNNKDGTLLILFKRIDNGWQAWLYNREVIPDCVLSIDDVKRISRDVAVHELRFKRYIGILYYPKQT